MMALGSKTCGAAIPIPCASSMVASSFPTKSRKSLSKRVTSMAAVLRMGSPTWAIGMVVIVPPCYSLPSGLIELVHIKIVILDLSDFGMFESNNGDTRVFKLFTMHVGIGHRKL